MRLGAQCVLIGKFAFGLFVHRHVWEVLFGLGAAKGGVSGIGPLPKAPYSDTVNTVVCSAAFCSFDARLRLSPAARLIRVASQKPHRHSVGAVAAVVRCGRWGLRIGITVHNTLCMVAWSLVLFYVFDVKA